MRTIEVPSGDLNQKIVHVPTMLTKRVLKIFNKCHKAEKMIIWKDFKEYIMKEWMIADYRADQCIEDARKVTQHEEFHNEN